MPGVIRHPEAGEPGAWIPAFAGMTGSYIASLFALSRMNKSAVVHARVEPQTKKQAESVLRKLGLTPTEAIRLFYRQICLHGGLPFPVLIPNALTKQTFEKSRAGEDVETFDTLEDMFESWEQ